MDPDAASHRDQPGWYRALPALVLVVGLLLTWMGWTQTRHALLSQAQHNAPALHQLQVRNLEIRMQQHAHLLGILARNGDTPAMRALVELPGWYGLIALAPEPSGEPDITMIRFAEDVSDQLKQAIMAPAFWDTLSAKVPADGDPIATPHFRANGIRLQGLATAQGSGPERQLLVSLYAPEVLIRESLGGTADAGLKTSVIDLQQHENAPVATLGGGHASGWAGETAVRVGDRQWLVRGNATTTVPGPPGQLLLDALAFGGCVLSLALGLFAWVLVRHHGMNVRQVLHLAQLRDRDQRALENKRIEKEVMSRALSDSEQRTRDFIQLGGGIGFELDDEHAIGYVSPQIQPILGHAPSDLTGLALTELLPDSEHQRLSDAILGSRRERTITRVDTVLERSDGGTVPMRIQICTVVDALSHCQGFRAVAWPRDTR